MNFQWWFLIVTLLFVCYANYFKIGRHPRKSSIPMLNKLNRFIYKLILWIDDIISTESLRREYPKETYGINFLNRQDLSTQLLLDSPHRLLRQVNNSLRFLESQFKQDSAEFGVNAPKLTRLKSQIIKQRFIRIKLHKKGHFTGSINLAYIISEKSSLFKNGMTPELIRKFVEENKWLDANRKVTYGNNIKFRILYDSLADKEIDFVTNNELKGPALSRLFSQILKVKLDQRIFCGKYKIYDDKEKEQMVLLLKKVKKEISGKLTETST